MEREPTTSDAQAIALDPDVYATCRRIAAKLLRAERGGHTLSATALVHEAFLKHAWSARPSEDDVTHLYASFARAMRQILVDHARGRRRMKRGGAHQRVTLSSVSLAAPEMPDVDVEALDIALERLARHDSRAARVVEMRFYADTPMELVAKHVGVALRTAEHDWQTARMWLARELERMR